MASLGAAPGLLVAAGVGAAASVALEPAFEVPKQDAWSRLPNKILGVDTLARLVAQGGVLLGTPDGKTAGSAYGEALRQGYGPDKFDRLVWLAQSAPDLTLTLELWRRGLFGDPTSQTALNFVEFTLAKHQVAPAFWKAIEELYAGRLDPAQVAVMVQRSILPNAADPATGQLLLPNQPSTEGSNVPPMPEVPIDPITEARAHGIDFDRLAAEARIVGLPASPDLAARMHFRNIITLGAFYQAAKEGNTRAEWAPFLLEGFREILTAHDYAELQLRGFLDRDQRRAQTDKHGMSHADSDLLYDVLGRSIPAHQIVTGEARGGTFNGPTDAIPQAFLETFQRSNSRPEYYNLEYHNRYSYPSAFFFRLLLQDGTITAAQAEQRFLEIGWPPDLAKEIAQALAAKAGTGAKADPYVKKADNQLWTALHKAYVKVGASRTDVEPLLIHLIPEQAPRFAVFDAWDLERQADALPAATPPPIG